MCLSMKQPDIPPDPVPPDPQKVAAQQQEEERKRRTVALNRQATILTSSKGASTYGQNARPTVTLLGGAA